MNIPAKITQIAPLATVQQGVVNYQVTVELTSTTPQTAGSPETVFFIRLHRRLQAISSIGNSSDRLPRDRLLLHLQLPVITLKDGLSVIVTIPIQSKTNVLMLPSRAITR